MSTHNLCFEQKYEKYQNFLSENFHFLVLQVSVYLNRRVFVMQNFIVHKAPKTLLLLVWHICNMLLKNIYCI